MAAGLPRLTVRSHLERLAAGKEPQVMFNRDFAYSPGRKVIIRLSRKSAVLGICAFTMGASFCAASSATCGLSKTSTAGTGRSDDLQVLVGFLEDAERYMGALEYIESVPQGYLSVEHRSIVRKCFLYSAGAWSSLSRLGSLPASGDPQPRDRWYAIVREKIVGTVVTVRQPDILEPLENSQEMLIISFDPLKARENEWLVAPWGADIRPPIVLSTSRHHGDPEAWHSISSFPHIASALATLNADATHDSFPGEVPISKISRDDLQVVKAFSNRLGDWLVALQLKKSASAYEDGPEGSYTYWLGSCDGGPVRFIGSGLALISTLDLNGDNLSEYLFW